MSENLETEAIPEPDEARQALRPAGELDWGGDRRIAGWLALLFLALYLLLARGHFISSDEVLFYQTAASIWNEGSLAVTTTLRGNGYPGLHGRQYLFYTSLQSFAAAPLHAAGRALDAALPPASPWRTVLFGRVAERKEAGMRWGGDGSIFGVSLFNAFAFAALVALFYLFARRLGASRRASLAGAALLGLSSYTATLATSFFLHTTEALFSLAAFYFVYRDAQRDDRGSRVAAALCALLLLLFRPSALGFFPALIVYQAHSLWSRRKPRWGRAALELLPLLASIPAASFVHGLFQQAKFGGMESAVLRERVTFTTPLLEGLFGYLLSPGMSLFLYSPLLLLLPWTMRRLYAERRKETLFVAAQSLCILLFVSHFTWWHGMWCYGPRYLAAVIPPLYLALPLWLDRERSNSWIAAPPALAGLWVVATGLAVNFWYVVVHEGYLDFKPQYGHLFIPRLSPLVAHSRALLAGRDLDMVLTRAWSAGVLYAALFALPLLAVVAVAAARIRALLMPAPETGWQLTPFLRRRALVSCACLVATIAGIVLIDRTAAGPAAPSAAASAPARPSPRR